MPITNSHLCLIINTIIKHFNAAVYSMIWLNASHVSLFLIMETCQMVTVVYKLQEAH